MLHRTELSAGDLAAISDMLPGREPALLPCRDGPRQGGCYRVAETRLAGNERRYLNECVDSNWISSLGPFVGRFEAAFAAQVRADHGVACANGTVALHLALVALGIGPSDEVLLPSFTMIAAANAVRHAGATPRLVDVESRYMNIDPDLLEKAISPRTKAIIVVHTYGHPADMERITRIARAHGLLLIEDAAEAHGAEIDGRKVGSFGDASTFSFYANKVITTGEGGMVCTGDPALAALVRRLRDHAFSPERHFWHEYLGFNYRMTNLQAAVGLAQTERIDDILAARRRLRGWYDERLSTIAGLGLPQEAPNARSVFWMYGIRVQPEVFGMTRDALREELGRRGIETRTFFVPLHLQPIYFDAFRGQPFPVAEALGRDGLYLPTFEALTETDADWICAEIRDIHEARR